MNNSLLEKVNQVSEKISDLELVKEYNKYSDLFNSSNELRQLSNEIKFLKKCDMSNDELEKYYALLKKYNSNPVVNNFNSLKKEIEELKMEVKNLIKL